MISQKTKKNGFLCVESSTKQMSVFDKPMAPKEIEILKTVDTLLTIKKALTI